MQAWRLGSYELVQRLGEGGMAQVYLARDVRLGREVAVKVLDTRLAERPGFRERFLREARVAGALDHPNIVPLYDFGDTDHLLYLVMPFISGGSLQDLLRRVPLPVGEVVTYGSQIADALEYAHKRNVVHRDVKPANMLIHADGRLMLSDFGLAKIISSAGRPASPRGHPDAGTPEYMAPEQIEGRTDARSDIYALGVVLYLLLTGHLPFTGSTSSAVMEGHLYRLPEDPRSLNPAITPAMQAVIARALAKHSEDRYQTAGELGAALLGALVAGDAEPLPFALGSSQPPRSLPSLPYGRSPAVSGPVAMPWSQPRAISGGGPQGMAEMLPALPDLGPLPPHRSPQPPATSGVYSPAAPGNSFGRMPIVVPPAGSFPNAAYPPVSPPMPLPLATDPRLAALPPAPPGYPTAGPAPLPRAHSTSSMFSAHQSSQRFWLWLAVALLIAAIAAGLLVGWVVGRGYSSGGIHEYPRVASISTWWSAPAASARWSTPAS